MQYSVLTASSGLLTDEPVLVLADKNTIPLLSLDETFGLEHEVSTAHGPVLPPILLCPRRLRWELMSRRPLSGQDPIPDVPVASFLFTHHLPLLLDRLADLELSLGPTS